MLFSRYCYAPAVAALLGLASGSPMPAADVAVPVAAVSRPLGRGELAVRGLDGAAAESQLEKRLEADFSMARTWTNEVLFSGSYTKHQDSTSETVALRVTCVECYTKGSVRASLTDSAIVDPMLRLDFSGVEAYVDLDVAVSAGATYTLNLFASDTPVGIGLPGLSVGVVFYLDLVFSLTDEIDFEAGFYMTLPDGAYVEASLLGGDVGKSLFAGLSGKSLPVTVRSGAATFKADLRLRVQCGASADLLDVFGIGAGAELGVFANLIEFEAVLETGAPGCELQSLEWWDLNVGAFAQLDVVVDYKTIGAVPTVSTTLLSAPTLTQCWIPAGASSSPHESGGGAVSISGGYVTVTTPPAHAVGGGSTTTTTSTASSSTECSSLVSGGTTITSSIAGGSGSSAASVSVSGSASTIKFPLTNSSSTAAPSTAPAASSLPTGFVTSIAPSSSSSSALLSSSTSAGGSSSSSSAAETITSTYSTTTTYTITSCAASVVNCPSSYQQEIVVTETVDLTTTICPVTAAAATTTTASSPSSSSAVSSASASASASAPASVTLVTVQSITDVVVLAPCATPIVQTWTAPSSLAAASSGAVVVQITATVLPATWHAGSGALPTAVPGAGEEAKQVQQVQQVQQQASSSSAYSAVSAGASASGWATGYAKPSASGVYTYTAPAAPSKTPAAPITAGAAGLRGGSGAAGFVAAAVVAVALVLV